MISNSLIRISMEFLSKSDSELTFQIELFDNK